MSELAWIVGSSVVMAVIALAGAVALLAAGRTIDKLVLPFVALAAGSLIGSAFFHMLPASLGQIRPDAAVWTLAIAGFSTFFALEQALHWHHRHANGGDTKPVTWFVLIGDGLHNFIDGIAVAGAYLIDVRLGAATTVAVAAHEIPQELGDFAVLLHGGWAPRKALAFNVLSALAFLAGGLLTYASRGAFDVAYLVPFAAGTFLYIGATDLVPEINKAGDARGNILHFAMFLIGIVLMYVARTME